MSNARYQNIVVLGREWRDGRFYPEPSQILRVKINNTVIISTPDASKLNDSHMLDLMALTWPGPDLFLAENTKPIQVFGEKISRYMKPIKDVESSSVSGKGISSKDIIKRCHSFIKTNDTYSFGAVLKRRRDQIEYTMPEKTDQDVPSPVPGGQQNIPQLTLVLLGDSGSGKSASGNTILGEKVFTSKPSSMPVTTECETQTKSICGTEVTVIDTPDFFDDSLQMQSRHILRCRELCREGVLCVYLLVIQIGRFTEGERDILDRLEKALETTVRDRAIILFTYGDDLRFPIKEYVKGTNKHLVQLIDKCGKRYHVFNNKTTVPTPNDGASSGWRLMFTRSGSISETDNHKTEAENQVKELMRKISDLVQG